MQTQFTSKPVKKRTSVDKRVYTSLFFSAVVQQKQCPLSSFFFFNYFFKILFWGTVCFTVAYLSYSVQISVSLRLISKWEFCHLHLYDWTRIHKLHAQTSAHSQAQWELLGIVKRLFRPECLQPKASEGSVIHPPLEGVKLPTISLFGKLMLWLLLGSCSSCCVRTAPLKFWCQLQNHFQV